MPDLTIGDILKSEADPNNRIAIPAPVGTKTGQLVKYAERKEYLIALSDETNGEVLVQPHNCVMNLAPIMQADIDAVFTDDLSAVPLTNAELLTQGDAHGIKYIGTPRA